MMTILAYRLWHAIGRLDSLLDRKNGANILFTLMIAPPAGLFLFSVGYVVVTGTHPAPAWVNLLIGLSAVWALLALVIVFGAGTAVSRYLTTCGTCVTVLSNTETDILWVWAREDSEANRVISPPSSMFAPLQDWITVPLPLSRKVALLRAGIQPAVAVSTETRRMTDEDLAIYAALLGMPSVSQLATVRGSTS